MTAKGTLKQMKIPFGYPASLRAEHQTFKDK
jgi:hypothetical protein